MIRRAESAMLPHLKQMWQVCFEDDEQSVDFVFANLLGPMQMLVEVDKGGAPIAMLNWKLLSFTTPERKLTGAYIYGIGTLPEHRGKGISTALIGKAHEILEKEGAALACLVPAQASLFDFYAARGFDTRFYYKAARMERSQIPQPKVEGVLSAGAMEDFAQLRSAWFVTRSLFGAWDASYLRYVGRECSFYGGEVLRFSCAGSVGYAVCYPREDGTLVIKEAVVAPEHIGVLLSALNARYRMKRYEMRLPADFVTPREWGIEILPFGMIKWYDKASAPSDAQGAAPWFAFGLDS